MERIEQKDLKKQISLDKQGKEIEKVLQHAVREALKLHKLADNPVAIWQDGKVVILSPDEVVL